VLQWQLVLFQVLDEIKIYVKLAARTSRLIVLLEITLEKLKPTL